MADSGRYQFSPFFGGPQGYGGKERTFRRNKPWQRNMGSSGLLLERLSYTPTFKRSRNYDPRSRGSGTIRTSFGTFNLDRQPQPTSKPTPAAVKPVEKKADRTVPENNQKPVIINTPKESPQRVIPEQGQTPVTIKPKPNILGNMFSGNRLGAAGVVGTPGGETSIRFDPNNPTFKKRKRVFQVTK